MSPLLTTRQVQDLLKVDRITIYRMLNDGRLKGVKIGKEWRFHRVEIEKMLGKPEIAAPDTPPEDILSEFPSGCVEKVEDLLGGILGIGVTTVTLSGEPLNAIANPNPFCQCILSSSSGCQACRAAWGKPAGENGNKPEFHTCHAGLTFLRCPVELDGRAVAWVIAGQFRMAPSNPAAESARIESLAELHGIQPRPLGEALRDVPVLSVEQQAQVEAWTPRLSKTIQSILQERQKLTERLQKISDLSSMRPVLTENQDGK
jgi:excisionase family DNA binding protein